MLPDTKQKKSASVKILTRSDGTESCPDAVLYDKTSKLLIVCDAKFYTNDLPERIILKTIDDMQLRDTEFGLLICSSQTKTKSYTEMPIEKRKNLKLVKLRPATGKVSTELNSDEYMPEYNTEKNKILI